MNYLEALSRCFPEAQVYVLDTGSVEVYADLNWITAVIPQATIESSQCVIDTFDAGTGEVVTTEYNVIDSSAIFTVTFNRESLANNVWLSHQGDGSLTSNATPAIIPWDCRLVALTFTNQTVAAGTDLQVYRADAGAGSVKTLAHTWELRDARLARKTVFAPDINFVAGDKVGIYLKDAVGDSPKYVAVTMYLQITNSLTADFSETFSGDF